MSSRLYFQNQEQKKHNLAMQALEFEIQAKDQVIWLREAHNIELMHWDKAQRAEIA